MRNQRTVSWTIRDLLVPIILGISILLLFYGSIVARISGFFFSVEGDGVKNYFTYLYHSLWDQQLLHFTGMNYPFGEVLYYAGSQPVLGLVGHLAVGAGTVSAPHLLTLFNGIVLFSPVVAAFFLFLILREFCAPLTFSALVAVGISFLSPQLPRMLGHFGLSHSAAIVSGLYFLFYFGKRPSLRRAFLVAVNSLFWASFHFYFLAFQVLMGGVYWLFALFLGILDRKPWFWSGSRYAREEGLFRLPRSDFGLTNARAIGLASLQLGLPLVCFALLVNSTDPELPHRIVSPAGADFDTYRATALGLLVPWARPLGPGLLERIAVLGTQAEGVAYLGSVTLLILAGLAASMMVSAVRQLKQKRNANGNWGFSVVFPGSGFSSYLVVVGLFALLISLGLPFRQFPAVSEWLGPIRQFRTVARFAWISYFAFSLVAFMQLYRLSEWLRFRGRGRSAWLLQMLPVLLLLLEGFSYSREITELMAVQGSECPSFLSRHRSSSQPGWHGIQCLADGASYQAILPLPYFHVGSDRDFRFLGSSESLRESFFLSLETGLPLMAAHLSRSSWRQTLWSLSIFNEDSETRSELRRHFPSERDLLILWTGEPLQPVEQRLLNRSMFLGSYRDGFLHRLRFVDLF